VVRAIQEEIAHAHAEVARRAALPISGSPTSTASKTITAGPAHDLALTASVVATCRGPARDGGAPADAPTLATHDQADSSAPQAQSTRGARYSRSARRAPACLGRPWPLGHHRRAVETQADACPPAPRRDGRSRGRRRRKHHRRRSAFAGGRACRGPSWSPKKIFGHRCTGRPRSNVCAALEDLRAGARRSPRARRPRIGRYLGLERKSVGGVGVEMLVVEYTGGDKLSLPVHRLNQVESIPCGGHGN
jgi:hypothetical protein